MSSYYHACRICGCPGVERDFNKCGSCAGKQHQAQTPAPALNAPLEAVQAVTEPTAQDWADFGAWCLEVDLRDQDLQDAHRELEYQDMLDAEL